MNEENLKERWETIDRKNIDNHNRAVKTRKINSIVILIIMVIMNAAFTASVFLSNLIALGFLATGFGLFITTLYLIHGVKATFKEPYRVYDPASNPMS